ncbi:hypothetical protein CK203_054748 [Vitis vinifera]|uniref:Uncharacterized protein n=1 Tax=Vitis vinifera TaxID=29760 RepID=A0A438GIV4_VITVI|nr:hypothetical protein CK203_054748 [Vitis vinifera]
MGRLIRKFFIYESVTPQKAKSHHFKNMIIGAQQAGMRIESPSSYKIKNKYLEMEYNHARKITNFIYNHGWLLAQMKKYCGGDIVQLGVTRLKLCDMEAENDRVAEKDYLDLLDISTELMLNVCCPKKFTLKVLAKILMIHFKWHWIPTKRLTPQVLAIVVDLVLYALLLLVTMVQEVELMMEDEDHGSRRDGPGIGAIGKPYRGRERTMEPYNEELLSGSFESMSIGTQFSDSSNKTNTTLLM